jgi:uncharacterized protein (DUF2141 family)
MSNKKGWFFSPFFLCLALLFFVLGCAVQQKPQGGPKDVTPPKLLKATPLNKTRNFNAKEIRLEFDEYFKLNNAFQEITMFPVPDKAPLYKGNKTLVVQLKDTLQKNTTYVINFGKAIADVNENNTVKNFTYVFSTGPHIDSLSIAGTVVNNETGLKEKDATVMVFTPKQDSVLFGKKKPSIYATTDSSGNFTISNLKEGIYKIYALREPSGGDKIYNNDNELISFSSKPINLTHDTSTVNLKLFKQAPTKPRFVTRTFTSDGAMFFVLNKRLEKPSLHIIYPQGLDQQKITTFTRTGDTAFVYSKNMDFDSIRFAFYDNNKPIDTTYLRKGRKESYSRSIAIRYGIDFGSGLKPGTDLNIYTSLPIQTVDQSLITLKEDSAEVKYTLVRDTGNMKNFTIKYHWKPKSSYAITIDEAAFIDIWGTKNKRQIKKFTINKLENYSNLTLNVNVPDTSKSYVVELLDAQKNPMRSDVIRKKTLLTYKNYYVGKFTVRVIYDDNKNGKWDSGSIKDNRQPENIWVYDKIFTLRPNWDSEEAVEVPPEAVNP